MSEDKANYNGPGKVKFVDGKRPEPSVTSALDVQTGGDHYKDMKIQPVEFIHANGLPFIEGAIIKYVCRHKAKNGRQDLERARHFIDMLLELEYPEEKDVPAEPEYLMLKEGDVVRRGDEHSQDDGNTWKPVMASVGSEAGGHSCFRRPMKGQDNG